MWLVKEENQTEREEEEVHVLLNLLASKSLFGIIR